MNDECIICFDEPEQFIFLPCTHKLCPRCKELLEQRKCPICNTPFESPFQPGPTIVLHRNTIVESSVMESSTKCIIFILLFFLFYVIYHVSRSDT